MESGQTGATGARALLLAAGLAIATGARANAQDPVEVLPPPVEVVDDLDDPDDFDDLDDFGVEDELLLFRDLPTVISGTRAARPIDESPVAIGVLTADDIHFSGATNLPEALQFVVGVDALRIDRNRYAVGIRGFHSQFSDRSIALIDGRNASSPLFGGPEYLRLPLFMEDIERVEVVRGPGGAVWGANAFNGVVNIITKRPGGVPEGLLTTTVNEFGDTYSQARYGGTAGALRYRVSLGYEDLEPSSEALTGESFESRDYSRGLRVDSVFELDVSERGRLEVGAAYADIDVGDFEFFGYQPRQPGHLRTFRSHVKYSETRGDRSHYVQAFVNAQDDNMPSVTAARSLEVDIETQFDFRLNDMHDIALGGNVRYVELRNQPYHPAHVSGSDPNSDEGWLGLFATDRLRFSRQVSLDSQGRVDYYDETGWDWSGRLAVVAHVDEDQRHTVRVGGARAFRTPLLGIRRSALRRPQFELVDIGDPDNENLTAAELGYIWRMSEQSTVQVETYYHRFEDLIGLQPIAAGPPQQAALTNIAGADGFGVEVDWTWRSEDRSLRGWYAYQDLDTDQNDQSIRAFSPATHKAGARARQRFGSGVTFDAAYKFSQGTPERADLRATPDFHRLDLVLGKEFFDGRGEFSLGVTDVLDEMGFPAADVGGAAHETPGRTFFMRMQLRF